jgi:hypothetical protein
MIKRILVLVLIVVLLVSIFTGLSTAASSEITMLDFTSDFLSSVIGLEMTAYSLAPPPSTFQHPNPTISDRYQTTMSELANVDFAGPSIDFASSRGRLHVTVYFQYGQLTTINIDPIMSTSYIYSQTLPSGLLGQTQTILQRYKEYFSRTYNQDSTFIEPMQVILSNHSDLSSTNLTSGNINFQVSKTGDRTRIQWIYTENGVSMSWKRVELEFYKTTIERFTDSWSYYKVSGLSVISAEEATQIAREAAQKVELHISNGNGTIQTINVANLLNGRVDVFFSMLPYSGSKENFPSNLTRNASTLYPYWQFHFDFNKSIAGNEGVQVGVWGDTGEIIYASGYGYLGSSNVSNGELPNDIPIVQPTEQKIQTVNSNVLILIVTISVIIATTFSLLLLLIRHRKQVNNPTHTTHCPNCTGDS